MPKSTKSDYRKKFQEFYESPLDFPSQIYLEQMPIIWDKFYQKLKSIMGRSFEARGFNKTEVLYMGEHGHGAKPKLI